MILVLKLLQTEINYPTPKSNTWSWAKSSNNNAIDFFFSLSYLSVHRYRALFTPSKTQRLSFSFSLFYSLTQRHCSAFLHRYRSTSLRHWLWHLYAPLFFHSSATFSSSILSNPNPWNCCAAGPKDWLKEQKKKSSKFLLAPVDASREILRSAYLFLSECFFLCLFRSRACFLSYSPFDSIISAAETDATYRDEDLEKIQQLFVSASRDCVPQDRNPFVTFQANTGVEVVLTF